MNECLENSKQKDCEPHITLAHRGSSPRQDTDSFIIKWWSHDQELTSVSVVLRVEFMSWSLMGVSVAQKLTISYMARAHGLVRQVHDILGMAQNSTPILRR